MLIYYCLNIEYYIRITLICNILTTLNTELFIADSEYYCMVL